MTKIAKLLTVAVVVATAITFFTLNSSYEIISGNIEALTGGDTGTSYPEPCIATLGRKASARETQDAYKPLFGVCLPQGFTGTTNVGSPHTINYTGYTDCALDSYTYAIYDYPYGQCVFWFLKPYAGSPEGTIVPCPVHNKR